jgi:oxygen-independent coproporphyrinogen-3 oxidase
MSKQEISIYIHYPFCLSKCPYCDFNSYIVNNIDKNQLKKCYIDEIKYYFDLTKEKVVKTIFFGGGTPSLMSIKMLSNILNTINNCWGIGDDVEVSLEANPTSVEIDKFVEYKTLGINRISIGVQSLRDDDLKFFGRTHTRIEALDAIKKAAKIFKDKYSIDLIYARPKQDLQEWIGELNEASELSPHHISLYQLTVSEGTVFFKKNISELDGEKANIMYNETRNYLNNRDIKMYEVSNYAMDGYECKHNLNYWNSGEWIGIGAGAHGRICFDNYADGYKIRTAIENHKDIGEWMDEVDKKHNGAKTIENLTKDEFREEVILMGLRIAKGITIDNVKKYLKINDFNELIFNKKNFLLLTKKKYIEVLNNSFRVKKGCFNILDSIVEKLL